MCPSKQTFWSWQQSTSIGVPLGRLDARASHIKWCIIGSQVGSLRQLDTSIIRADVSLLRIDEAAAEDSVDSLFSIPDGNFIPIVGRLLEIFYAMLWYPLFICKVGYPSGGWHLLDPRKPLEIANSILRGVKTIIPMQTI